MQCFLRVRQDEVKVHIRLLKYIFSVDPPDFINQTLRLFDMSCYMDQVKDRTEHSQFLLPNFERKLCCDDWCSLLNMIVLKYKNWRSMDLPERDVMPTFQGLIGQDDNAAKPETRQSIVHFVRRVADYDGHSLPVRILAADERIIENIECTETLVLLPPMYNKRTMYKAYVKIYSEGTDL